MTIILFLPTSVPFHEQSKKPPRFRPIRTTCLVGHGPEAEAEADFPCGMRRGGGGGIVRFGQRRRRPS